MSKISGVHHVAFTVTDLPASVAWYRDLFDMQVVMEEPHDGGGATILREPQSGLFIGLHTHQASAAAHFDETVIGLDHVSFAVPDRELLQSWELRLKERKVDYSPIVDMPYGSVIVCRDPDNIQLEFIAPPT